ncbi:MAG: ParA family protein [Anaerolineaceae bacterium]|nr:ParA family protein [Anaerolineaceae bacterium]
MAKIYTIVNQKGGVGKTTSSINLGAYLGFFGQKVLLIDLDPQANATSCLGLDKNNISQGSYEVLINGAKPREAILHNARFALSILPSSPNLAGAEIELIEMENRERKLKAVVDELHEKYDYILIDCPPSLGLLTLNGLIAAHNGVIIPVQCEYLALEGLGQLMQTLTRIRENMAPALDIRGVLLTMYDGRTNLANDVMQEVQKFFPNKVFSTIIPRGIRLAEAPSFGMPVSVYAPESSGGKAYRALAQEILSADGVQFDPNKE